jgi:hypothetical protein
MSSSDNTFKVPLKQWRKWTPAARKVFNETYDTMLNNQGLFQHPKTAAVPQVQWKTTAWNAAWTAADVVVDAVFWSGDVVKDVTPKGKVVREQHVKRSSSSRADDRKSSVKRSDNVKSHGLGLL